MDAHISTFVRKEEVKLHAVTKPSILPVTLVLLFYSNTLPFLCKWNSYSHIPEPLNLVPNLPGRPTLHVPTLPNINSLTMRTNYTHTACTLLG